MLNSKNHSSSQEKTLKYFAINKGFQVYMFEYFYSPPQQAIVNNDPKNL